MSVTDLDLAAAQALLPPPRPRDSHKGLFGRVAIIGGDSGMTGAALLAGRAALKLGAGCVRVGLLSDAAPTVDAIQPELMLEPAARLDLAQADVVAIGCGLGQTTAAHTLLARVLPLNIPLILDADALNLLADDETLRARLWLRSATTLLTPHPGEAARLLACSTADVQADRPAAARQLVERYGCALVLKGADSLLVSSEGQLWRNGSGNPGMSAPGMGDVLTGMIAALLGQQRCSNSALKLAVYLHGAAGDALAARGIAVGMTASELTDAARELLNRWQRQRIS